MKNKEKILRIDVVVQLILFIGIVFTVIIENQIFFYFFFSFAITQVVSAFLYNDPRKMAYLKAVFWINVFGTGLIFLFAAIDLEEIGSLIFIISWIISPFFLAGWAFYNSYWAWQDAKLERNNL